jgi:hypothetical protein
MVLVTSSFEINIMTPDCRRPSHLITNKRTSSSSSSSSSYRHLSLLCLIPYGLSRWITSRRVTPVTYQLLVLPSTPHTRNISAFICNNDCINLLCQELRRIPACAAVRHVYLNNAFEFCVSPLTISYTSLRR